ncbi:MAG TPA: MATE family efflux transporter [Candidatus Hydrogenedentes bacterium]|nr:MATE family efflux transporter [Candidatus Hydrogenedentota bacterium]
MKPFDEQLVSGSIVRSVWKLAWPIVLMNLINGVHGMVDQALIGHTVERDAANAAVGVSWNLFLVIVVSLASLFHGMGVLIAQAAGRQDRVEMNRVLYHTGLLTSYIVIFVVTPIGYLLAPYLLQTARPTQEVAEFALPYLRMLFLFSITLSLNFLFGIAMQTSGDAKRPLMLVVLTTVLHIVLSAVFITGIGPFPKLGTTGAALGAGLAPIPSLCIALWLIVSKRAILGMPDSFPLVPDWKVIRAVMRIGIPSGIHAVVLNIGGIWLYRYIGYLPDSSAAQAAYTLCYAQLFSFVTWAALGLRGSASALMGQNIGAGKAERGRRGVHVAAAMGAAWAIAWGLAVYMWPHKFLGLFYPAENTHSMVMQYGESLLKYLSVSGVFLAVALALTGGLMGAGDTKKPMYIAIITQIFILLGVCELFYRFGELTASAVWSAILISHFSRYLFTHIVFHQARLRPTTINTA